MLRRQLPIFGCLTLFLAMISIPTLIVPAMATSGLTGSKTGGLEIRVTDHKPGIDQFSWLKVSLGISVHQKDKGRREGWIELISESDGIDIVPLKDGRFQSLGEFDLPAGDYDAIRINFVRTDGYLKVGKKPNLNGDSAVVAAQFSINQQPGEPLVVDLYAEDQSEHIPPVYQVKVKEVRFGK